MPLKAYMYGGLALLIIAAIVYVSFLKESRDKYQSQAALEQSEKEKAIKTIIAMTADQKKAEENRATYLSELETNKNERIRLENCIADKSCVATIRVRSPATTCTATATPNTGGTDSAVAELDPNAERAYTNLRAGIQELESKYRLCQKTIKDWSQP